MARLWAGLLATSPLEALAVLSGLVYVVLAVPRSRWCWVAGGFSSLIYVWLSARAIAHAVAAAGLVRRRRRLWLPALVARGYDGRLATVVARPRRRYCRVAAAGCGHRAFPGRGNAGGLAHLDASTTMLSLFASWLTARAKLESWLYWIVVDTVLAWLYAAQGLVFTAFLFVVYLVIAAAGFIEWSKTYRRQTAV
jgi:nicotinamide mononucleotide transporter